MVSEGGDCYKKKGIGHRGPIPRYILAVEKDYIKFGEELELYLSYPQLSVLQTEPIYRVQHHITEESFRATIGA